MRFSDRIEQYKALIAGEAMAVHGFMQLLMNPRNGQRWSAEDKRALRTHLRRMATSLPWLGIFALPGGSLLLPLLSWLLDRRRSRRSRGGLPSSARRAPVDEVSHKAP